MCSFIWAIFVCLGAPGILEGGRALGIQPGEATLFAALWRCLWGRGQRENSAACLLLSRELFNKLSCETGSFSHCGNPSCSPRSALRPSFPLKSAPPSKSALLSSSSPHGVLVFLSRPAPSAALQTWLFWLIFSLIPWLLEFHAIWFPGTSGCLLIWDWLLSSFWLCEEMKGFYLCLHLGWNPHKYFFCTLKR